MNAAQIFIGILGAGIGTGLMQFLLEVFKRKWKKEDTEQDKLAKLIRSQKIMMSDRIHYIGRKCIDKEKITLEEKETIAEMYKSYKELGGNGKLNTIMAELDRLPISHE